jgi:hypothetical protein
MIPRGADPRNPRAALDERDGRARARRARPKLSVCGMVYFDL